MTNSQEFVYQGQELDVFASAVHWKEYWASRLRRWVRGDVLEVGAGLGANTALLQNPAVQSWQCLEPDPRLAATLSSAISGMTRCSVKTGTVGSLSGVMFDSVLYIDVLEHIEEDAAELAQAARMLRPGGHLLVLSPAHQFLFSPFDASIGHFRRYNRKSLAACSPPDCRLETMFYLDCVGMFASLANRVLLRQSQPGSAQIAFWDKYIVRTSRIVDGLFGYRLGKTLCAVWTRQ